MYTNHEIKKEKFKTKWHVLHMMSIYTTETSNYTRLID